ncbi:MAG TPA: primosomal protein N' [Cyclobacteriaceae bacterium]|nr:primosomal protein N' [Cyclobacteriaceae bacterium]
MTLDRLLGDIFEQEDKPAVFADIILPVPIPRMYTYRVPRSMEASVGIGHRVIVQFGTKKILTGIIGKVHSKAPDIYETKPLLELLDEHPIVNPLQIKFWSWMAAYYCCHIGEVMNAALPTGLKLSSESKIQLNPNFDETKTGYPIDYRERVILDALESRDELTYGECEKLLQVKSAYSIIKSLVTKEAVLVYEHVKEKYSPKVENRVRLAHKLTVDKASLEALFEQLSKRPKQEEILLKYLQQIPVYQHPALNERGLDKKVLIDAGLSPSALGTLIKNGIFEEYKVIVSRIENLESTEANPKLADYQLEAIEDIKKNFDSHITVLLHGITGSGKTEIYIQLIQEVLESGSQVLLLLPEIALTTHMVSRLQKVFGSKMGVYHSKYSDNERVEVWQGVLTGKYAFVVGVRSSIFLPFDSLGLVIVDEEHETSYKQYEPAPRFHARDAAIMLAWLHKSKTLLGSATPSFESFHNVQIKKYGYCYLNRRYGGAVLPDFFLADVLQDQKKNLLKLDFTRILREKIQEALNNQEQVLIFQNRRGYAPYVSCDECGYIPGCEQCDVSLTYHQFREEMRCHYCGFKEKVPLVCPACGSNKLNTVGQGTERIEESLSLLFPEARIARMDLDTTRSKFGYQRILEDFGSGNIDILVGTQMITKGLDFDKVTVVGIVDADRILYYPDFRSTERAFHQITQVAGRAGRRESKGKVIIQTRRTDQPIFSKIIEGDFYRFYQEEMSERQHFLYPPFVKLIKITVKHKEVLVAEKAAKYLVNLLSEIPVNKMVLGPEKALIAKVKNQYLYDIMIKVGKHGNAQALFKRELNAKIEALQGYKELKSARIVVDVDPY